MKINKRSPAAAPPRARLDNRLIASLPAQEREALLSRLTPVDLAFGQIIYEPFEQITEIYFPLDALISLLSTTTAGSTIEVGMVGNEGLMGAVALLEKETLPYRALVQDSGAALKIELFTMRHLTFALLAMFACGIFLEIKSTVQEKRKHGRSHSKAA